MLALEPLLALLLAAGPPLRAPAALTVKVAGPYSASISWKPPIDALGVELEARRVVKGHWTRLALQPARPMEFIAHALPPETALEVRARSWNGRAPSAWTQPVSFRTRPYAEPPLAVDAPCVPREKLLETALGHPPGKGDPCEASKLQSSPLQAGALELLLVDPVGDAPDCHGGGGNLDEAFAKAGGCLRHVGKLVEASLPVNLPRVAVPPLRSYWRESAFSGQVSIVELREGRLRVVDTGPLDSACEKADLPCTTDRELLSQLQGAAGAPPLDR